MNTRLALQMLYFKVQMIAYIRGANLFRKTSSLKKQDIFFGDEKEAKEDFTS